tara:strand:+ start:125 stop:499 length:375 start_codon:yes stop_codon:yes gene_type:complete
VSTDVELLLKRKKPVATVTKEKNPALYAFLEWIIDDNNAYIPRVNLFGFAYRDVGVVALARQNKDLLEYDKVFQSRVTGLAYNIRMGRVLGYSDKDILEYLETSPQCDCVECVGYHPFVERVEP